MSTPQPLCRTGHDRLSRPTAAHRLGGATAGAGVLPTSLAGRAAPAPALLRAVIAVHGDVDAATSGRLAELLEGATRAWTTPGDLFVDLAGVSFIDVAGTRVLVVAAGHLPKGSHLVVLHPPRNLEHILDVAWGTIPGLRLERTAADAGR